MFDDRDTVFFRIGRAFPNLSFDGFFALVIAGIAGVNYGGHLISVKEPIAEGSQGILVETLLEGMAEYYSAELSEKVIDRKSTRLNSSH